MGGTRVDGNGAVLGAYCHRYPAFHSLGVIELHPEQATDATLVDDAVRFEVGTSHIEATLDGDELVFSNRRSESDARSVLRMARIDAPACTAQYIGHVITEVSGTGQSLAALMPKHADHALIGHWAGVDPDTSLIVELTIVDTDNGYASGVFCNAWSVNAAYFYALDPTAGFLASVTPDSLQFDVNTVAFDFQLEDNTLRMTRTAGEDTRTLTLKRTDAPTCARRFIPSPLPKA